MFLGSVTATVYAATTGSCTVKSCQQDDKDKKDCKKEGEEKKCCAKDKK